MIAFLKQYWPLAFVLLLVAVIIGSENNAFQFLAQFGSPPVCGNNFLEPPEECDRGPMNGQTPGCTTKCKLECFTCIPGAEPCDKYTGLAYCGGGGPNV